MKTSISEFADEKLTATFYSILVRQEVSRSLNPRKKISHSEAHHIRNAIITIGLGFLLALTMVVVFFIVSSTLVN